MADFEPKRKSATDFNGGVKIVKDDLIHEDFFNNIVESQLFTQGLATNAPDVSEIDGDGKAGMEITTAADGSARLKPKNLKGKRGIGIEDILQGGYEDVGDGYTRTDLAFVMDDNENDPTTHGISVYAKNGKNVTPITDISDGAPSVSGNTTITPIIFKTQDDTFTVYVSATNGSNGRDAATITNIAVVKVS